jgi:uncharacterized protein YjbJ (UPF0337 family)
MAPYPSAPSWFSSTHTITPRSHNPNRTYTFLPTCLNHPRSTLSSTFYLPSNIKRIDNGSPIHAPVYSNSTVGGIKETVGNVTGIESLQSGGASQRREGDAEYKAAQAQGYAEGTKDREWSSAFEVCHMMSGVPDSDSHRYSIGVHGKFDNVVGSLTGDKEQQAKGQARETKGLVISGSPFVPRELSILTTTSESPCSQWDPAGLQLVNGFEFVSSGHVYGRFGY